MNEACLNSTVFNITDIKKLMSEAIREGRVESVSERSKEVMLDILMRF
jgi:hypothetical protein